MNSHVKNRFSSPRLMAGKCLMPPSSSWAFPLFTVLPILPTAIIYSPFGRFLLPFLSSPPFPWFFPRPRNKPKFFGFFFTLSILESLLRAVKKAHVSSGCFPSLTRWQGLPLVSSGEVEIVGSTRGPPKSSFPLLFGIATLAGSPSTRVLSPTFQRPFF